MKANHLEKLEQCQAEKGEKLTNLAVCRSLQANPALLFGASSKTGEESPVIVQDVAVLGIKGQYGISAKEAAQPNPQRSEQAFLKDDEDTLIYRYTVRLNGNSGLPIEACNSERTNTHLGGLFKAYAEAGGTDYLGSLYAANIADIRPAFRNRAFTEAITTVDVHCAKAETDDHFEFKMKAADLPRLDAQNSDNPVTDEETLRLGKLIGKGLSGEDLVFLTVESRLIVGFGQEVFPSQEMVSNKRENAPSRIYYKDDTTRQAKVHAQKVANGIRTIDIWHPEVSIYGAIAAEPYGNNVRRARTFRYGHSFFDMLGSEHKAIVKSKNAPELTQFAEKLLDAESIEDLHKIPDAHFFFALLMRGGVLGMKTGD